MNQIRAIQALNKKEIENGISPNASWHVDYRDTAYVYFGGLPYDMSEGDVITVFSQFGEPTFLKLVRDKETGKSKGFGWLKYEDQRSTDLAVDNLGGADIAGRLVRVDHARYQARDDEDQEEFKVGWEDIMKKEGEKVEDSESEDEEIKRPPLPEERELALLMRDHDDDDPMKAFLIEEKKKEVDEARRKADKKERRHKDKEHRSHRSRRDRSKERHSRRSGREEVDNREDSRDRDRRRRRRDEDQDRHRDRRHRERIEDSDEPRNKRRREHDDDRRSRRQKSRSSSPHRKN
ncbi:hypothetical protein N3K66_000065 [Trichothecium roseum]|uniref:Uncharacterized protein n=1 Tax=Trichothecium roseum TaxID=47278 RepID=A0ACC0VAR3_9HYPO|nr:hypothetical protein N3K66_000065 [Trichothecium roseum]